MFESESENKIGREMAVFETRFGIDSPVLGGKSFDNSEYTCDSLTWCGYDRRSEQTGEGTVDDARDCQRGGRVWASGRRGDR